MLVVDSGINDCDWDVFGTCCKVPSFRSPQIKVQVCSRSIGLPYVRSIEQMPLSVEEGVVGQG